MKRQTLKQLQTAAGAVHYICDNVGHQKKRHQEMERQLRRALAWAAFAQGFGYDDVGEGRTPLVTED